MKAARATVLGVSIAALLVSVPYAQAQNKTREDIEECTPTAAEVAEHRDLAGRLASTDPFLATALTHPQFHRIVGIDADRIIWVEDCVDARAEARWGPWNAWNRLERLERLLGHDPD